MTQKIIRYFEWKNLLGQTRNIKKVYIIGEFTNWKPVHLKPRNFDNEDGNIYRIRITFTDILNKGVFMYKYIIVTKNPNAIVKEDVTVNWECDPHVACIYDGNGNLNNITETLDLALHEHNQFEHYMDAYEVYGSLESTIHNSCIVSCDGCSVECSNDFYHCGECNKFDYCEECYNHPYRKNSTILSDPVKRAEWVVATKVFKIIEDNPPMFRKELDVIMLNDIDKLQDILKENKSDLIYELNYSDILGEYLFSKEKIKDEIQLIHEIIELLRKFVYKVTGKNTDWYNLKDTLKIE